MAAALVQPAPGGSAPDPAAELRSTLAARVALQALWNKFATDTTAAQDLALTAVASAQTFVDFSSQMDKIIQAATDFQTARDKKDAEAKWLDEHGVSLIKDNHKVAEAVEKELGKSSQLKIFEAWEKVAKSKSVPAALAKPKAAKGKAAGSPAGKKP
jgi:hypothetical protein